MRLVKWWNFCFGGCINNLGFYLACCCFMPMMESFYKQSILSLPNFSDPDLHLGPWPWLIAFSQRSNSCTDSSFLWPSGSFCVLDNFCHLSCCIIAFKNHLCISSCLKEALSFVTDLLPNITWSWFIKRAFMNFLMKRIKTMVTCCTKCKH